MPRQLMMSTDPDLDVIHKGIIADANGRPFHILGISDCQGKLLAGLHPDGAPQYLELVKGSMAH